METFSITKTPTSKENLEKIERMYRSLREPLVNLYMRWQDEKEYEDIEDYGKALMNQLPPDIQMVRMLKTPFGFTFKLKGFEEALYQVTISSESYGWKRVV